MEALSNIARKLGLRPEKPSIRPILERLIDGVESDLIQLRYQLRRAASPEEAASITEDIERKERILKDTKELLLSES